jgi:hypothetical protein
MDQEKIIRDGFVNIVLDKILENYSILIDELQSNFIKLPVTGRVTAITLSTAITLDLLFLNKKYTGFDIDSLLETITDFIIRNQNLIIAGTNYQEAILDDIFFEQQISESLNNFKELNFNRSLVLHEVNSLIDEHNTVVAITIAKLNPLFYYNAFISLYIFPFINSLENSEEKIKLIKEKLDSNSDFVNSKNDFTIPMNKIICAIIKNLSSDMFLNSVKPFKIASKLDIKNENENKNNNITTANNNNKSLNLKATIENFINNDDLKTLVLDFSSLNATLSQGKKEIYLNQQLPRYRVYITKHLFFHTLGFWFIDGGKIVFSLVSRIDEIPNNKISDSLTFNNFESLDADLVRGNEIKIFDKYISVDAILKNEKKIFDIKYIRHFYENLLAVHFHNNLLDINELIILKAENKNCYIATLVYEDINHPKVEFLRQFRDKKLLTTLWGKLFVRLYYFISPSLVERLKPFKKIQIFIRIILDKIIANIFKRQTITAQTTDMKIFNKF